MVTEKPSWSPQVTRALVLGAVSVSIHMGSMFVPLLMEGRSYEGEDAWARLQGDMSQIVQLQGVCSLIANVVAIVGVVYCVKASRWVCFSWKVLLVWILNILGLGLSSFVFSAA